MGDNSGRAHVCRIYAVHILAELPQYIFPLQQSGTEIGIIYSYTIYGKYYTDSETYLFMFNIVINKPQFIKEK